jgi:hypothetical protein
METKIGTIIFDYCRKHDVSVTSLAVKLNMTPEGVYRLLKKDDLRVSRLSQSVVR